jgi:LPXTG-motif cell wall-anchored protein
MKRTDLTKERVEKASKHAYSKATKGAFYAGAALLTLGTAAAFGNTGANAAAVEQGSAGTPTTEQIKNDQSSNKAAVADQNNQNDSNPTGKTQEDLDAYASGLQAGKKGAQPGVSTGKSADVDEAFNSGITAGNAQRKADAETAANKAKAAAADQSNQNNANQTGKSQVNLDAYNKGLQLGLKGAASLPAAFTNGQSSDYIEAIKSGFAAGAATHAQRLAASKNDEANTAFRAGQQYGETGAALPDLAGKSDNYKTNFAQGFNAGAATRAQKLAAKKAAAEDQASHMGQATTPDQATIDAASKKDEANTAFRAGQQYGETGAVLPDLAGKSDNYKTNFAQGFNAGAATRAQKLESAAAEKAEKDANAEANKLENLPNKSTEASDKAAALNKAGNDAFGPNKSTQASDAARVAGEWNASHKTIVDTPNMSTLASMKAEADAKQAAKDAAAKAAQEQAIKDAIAKAKAEQAAADAKNAAKDSAKGDTTTDATTTAKGTDTQADATTATNGVATTGTQATTTAATSELAAKAATATPAAATTTATAAATKAAATTLPQTGEANNAALAGLGVLSVMGALFGLAGTRKREF